MMTMAYGQNTQMIDCRFANLGSPERIFAVPSIHGNLNKLHAVHEGIFQQFRPGDRLIYLGNYTGYGAHSRQTINAILNFRRFILSIPGVQPSDIVYLRGTQEEMWQKVLQIQFAPNPAQILEWMLSQGLAQTMESYDVCLNEAQRVVHEGVIRLSRWTESVRQKVYNNAGHDIFGAQLKRAAYTDCHMNKVHGTCSPVLFVNAGIDASRPLEDQNDCFWWGHPHFKSIQSPYGMFQRIIRGYDPQNGGLDISGIAATLDNNSGRGGDLVYAEIAGNGEYLNVLAA